MGTGLPTGLLAQHLLVFGPRNQTWGELTEENKKKKVEKEKEKERMLYL